MLEQQAIDFVAATEATTEAYDRELFNLKGQVDSFLADQQSDDAQIARDMAESYHCEGSVEIDEQATVSLGDDGAYVAAWVYVSTG